MPRHAKILTRSKLEPSPVSRRAAMTPSEPHIAPPRGEQIFGISAAKTSKSLKKSRAVRARKTPKSDQHQNSALDNAKSEDPAKMTHSIPDFASCYGVYFVVVLVRASIMGVLGLWRLNLRAPSYGVYYVAHLRPLLPTH